MPPNILLIWTDEQRADTMRCYGNSFVHAPHLNRLAEESLVFEHAYCTQPICTPSRASILTGLYPHAHGCVANNTPLSTSHATLAEMAGRYACSYFGKWHLGDEIIAQRGFTNWLSIEDGIYRPYFSNPEYHSHFSDYHHYLYDLGYFPDTKAKDGAMVFSRRATALLPAEHTKAGFLGRKAAEFIANRPGEAPWLLSVSFLEPHMPFFGPYNDRYDPDTIPTGPAFALPPDAHASARKRDKAAQFREQGFEGRPLQSERDWRRMRANYYGLVSLVDEAVGRILAALECSGQAENTIVIFTSDHGEMMGDHACLAKSLTYEESIRVPLLVRVPGERGRTLPGRVSQIDLAPTILDFMGQRAPAQLQGKSLRPVMRGEATLAGNDVFVEWNNGEAWRTIVSREGWKLNLCATDRSEYYDLNTDPHELDNRYTDPSCRSQVELLTARIRAWQAETGDTAPLP